MSGIRQLRIGPYIYRVEYVDGLRADDDTRLAGNIEYERAVISIDQNSIEAVQLVTLFHEVIHGILANAGITHHKERLIDAIATGLVQVLIDNPALAEEFVRPECDHGYDENGVEACTESDVLKKLGDVGLAK
jgi:hypothetical protein